MEYVLCGAALLLLLLVAALLSEPHKVMSFDGRYYYITEYFDVSAGGWLACNRDDPLPWLPFSMWKVKSGITLPATSSEAARYRFWLKFHCEPEQP